MSKTNELARKLVDLDLQIDDLTKMLDEAKAKRKELVEHDLPTAMRAQQLNTFETTVGNRQYKLAIKHKIVGSLSRAPDVDAGLDYLVEKGFSGAANCTISVTVPDDERAEVIEVLADRGDAPKVERKVNHMTLAAFARECISNGDGFDLDKVGLTTLTETTIKETK